MCSIKHCGNCKNNVGDSDMPIGNIICKEFQKTLPTATVNPSLSSSCAYWKGSCGFSCSGCKRK